MFNTLYLCEKLGKRAIFLSSEIRDAIPLLTCELKPMAASPCPRDREVLKSWTTERSSSRSRPMIVVLLQCIETRAVTDKPLEVTAGMPVYRASDILNQLARIRGQVKESLGGRPDLQSSSASECTGAEHQVPASKKAELWKKWIPAARLQAAPV
ncbi:hypothetical protein AK812_SmicGene16548 [Symbiodinium microadriaticum]|uniref:Uncharacterized protein n=1 Tax=Symbiodinium microadriaticum TaxID=2951 RepID=A0A1Q9E048_SYMMI|nr:hypothetical protein AK812_SmicGene16548 [Symbiodinium microadriaticum]